MNDTGVCDEAKLHVIAKTHQRCCHHRLHEVIGVSRDGPVLLGGDPLFELLPLLRRCLQRCYDFAALGMFAVNAIGKDSASGQTGTPGWFIRHTGAANQAGGNQGENKAIYSHEINVGQGLKV